MEGHPINGARAAGRRVQSNDDDAGLQRPRVGSAQWAEILDPRPLPPSRRRWPAPNSPAGMPSIRTHPVAQITHRTSRGVPEDPSGELVMRPRPTAEVCQSCGRSCHGSAYDKQTITSESQRISGSPRSSWNTPAESVSRVGCCRCDHTSRAGEAAPVPASTALAHHGRHGPAREAPATCATSTTRAVRAPLLSQSSLLEAHDRFGDIGALWRAMAESGGSIEIRHYDRLGELKRGRPAVWDSVAEVRRLRAAGDSYPPPFGVVQLSTAVSAASSSRRSSLLRPGLASMTLHLTNAHDVVVIRASSVEFSS